MGIETAFITIPGHLYLAISLETSPDKARAEIANAGDLIYRDGKAWMPLELTMRDNTLAEIWAEGAREWRQGVSTANAGFFPVHEAWKTFAPVGLPADGRSLEALAAEKVVRAFRSEAELLVRQEMDARIATVNGDIKKNGETPKLLNQRGVAYARFGQLDLAAKDFAAAGKKGDFLPALVNLGNVAMLKNDGKLAWDSFQKAAKLSPDNVAILASRDKAAALAGKAAQPVMASAGGKAGTAAPGTGAAAAVPLGESGMRAAQVTTGPEWMEE